MSAIFRVRNHRMSFAIGPLQHSENSIYQAFNKTNCMLARLRNRKKIPAFFGSNRSAGYRCVVLKPLTVAVFSYIVQVMAI